MTSRVLYFKGILLLIFLIGCTNEKKMTYYYDSGAKRSEGTELDSFRQGKWFIYEENGDTAQISEYMNDTLHGESLFFLEGSLESKVNFKMGKMDGEATYYYPSGSIRYKGIMKNGLQVGNWMFFHSNGALESEVVMEDGKPTGNLLKYYSNGAVEMKGSNYYGNGEFEKYDSLGTLLWKMRFQDGEVVDTIFLRGSPASPSSEVRQ